MRFRPCIDLKDGRVVQIVGGTLRDDAPGAAIVNFVAEPPPSVFACRYRADGLSGGHVIALGPGNEAAARDALAAYPGGLHYGGGVTADNASLYLDAGASHVIVTSFVFREGCLDDGRLAQLVASVGRERLVLDLSCRRRGDGYRVTSDRWQRFTELDVSEATLAALADSCAEFLVHGVDVEGRRQGIEADLVERLGAWSPIPVTYAGGIRSLDDLALVKTLGRGRVDGSIGSALDLFGGTLPYDAVVAWQRTEDAL
jgi:phosphoribosylformimino-5-aminoimidazole carboxamide ribotide isomerase